MTPGFKRQPLIRFLGSVKLMIALAFLFALGSAAATFIESAQGTPAARALVYNATWFEIVIGLLVLNLIVMLLVRMPYRASQTGFVIVHIAVIVILLSAGITRFFGFEGIMPIREGQSTDFILSSKDYIQIESEDESAAFPVLLYRSGEQSASGDLALGGETYRVSVAEFWSHYSEEIREAEGGVPAISFASTGEGGLEENTLMVGSELEVAGVQVRFLTGDFTEGDVDAPGGLLHIHHEGEFVKLPIEAEAKGEIAVGDLRFRITEFHADYARRLERPEPVEMKNPMIRVEITNEDGQSGERILFAYFPEFSMGHGGGEDPFPDVMLSYTFERRFELSTGAGGLRARASFPIEVMDMSSSDVAKRHAAMAVFDLETLELYRAGDFRFVATDVWESALLAPVSSDDSGLPSAARILVEGPGGTQADALVRRGVASQVMLGDRALALRFGPQRIELPYSLFLDDFIMKTYPGSMNPSGYESLVRVQDPERGIEDEPVRIYMNHPLNYRGYKHFQSSYDPDHRGTVLSVNHDPGKWPTYSGYILIGIGFVLILAKGLLWPGGGRRAAKEAA